MIARIKGKIIERNANCLLIDTGSISYEVFLPQAVMQRLDETISGDGQINLITYHYHQVEPSKSTPILIGFLNEIEKEFFQVFITVSGIGPRAALKAINKPISLIAQAIDEGDINFLKSLPGIGQQKARDIIAKLQNKVGKFGLIQDKAVKEIGSKASDIIEEAVEVLTQLEYKKSEAQHMVKRALERSQNIDSTEQLLNEVYKQKKLK
jgi:Holliday junction DNA helicase RuvA